jgi:IS30 family transposase
MAQHAELADHFSEGIYFAHPASPWLRGTNENTNGFLRQYFRKGTSLAGHDADHLQRFQDRLNNRPRKVLGWKPLPRFSPHP